jgi:dephospho-CoA kinase
MLRVGLTGGIGCGKSTVASFLRDHGVPVLDADSVAHEVIATGGPAHDDVVHAFGPVILDIHGNIDRQMLARIAFADHRSLMKLNWLIHPHVAKAIDLQLADWSKPGGPAVAVVEAALLIEAGYRDSLDRMIVVWCTPEQQQERLLARGLSAEQIALRMAAQMPIDAKRRSATDEVDNSGSIEQTRAQMDRLYESLYHAAATQDGERR